MQLMSRKAFTLVELLVVIVIISVLMAIMLPSMSAARQQGKQTYCLNNLRQMIMAVQAYTQIYDDYYPTAHFIQQTDSRTCEHCWDFSTITETVGNKVKVVPGLLWQGQTIEKVQQCPSFKGSSNTQYDPYTGYNYNTSYIGHGEGETIETPARISQVGRPSECALFGDGQWSGGANKFMRAPKKWAGDTDNSLKAAGTQGYRHREKTNVAWCDGHTTSPKEYYTETAQSEKKKIERYNKNAEDKIGFLSPDNSAYDLE
jgi:prepilin-type N-terminal cleavage/methylation domain-containing protein/prepilin-type processing-associated H-X9-DG protein